jgi:hypothetical protein
MKLDQTSPTISFCADIYTLSFYLKINFALEYGKQIILKKDV